jgi:hypothetical protein
LSFRDLRLEVRAVRIGGEDAAASEVEMKTGPDIPSLGTVAFGSALRAATALWIKIDHGRTSALFEFALAS